MSTDLIKRQIVARQLGKENLTLFNVYKKEMWYDCLCDSHPKHINYRHRHVALRP